jgi:hypothetical protein
LPCVASRWASSVRSRSCCSASSSRPSVANAALISADISPATTLAFSLSTPAASSRSCRYLVSHGSRSAQTVGMVRTPGGPCRQRAGDGGRSGRWPAGPVSPGEKQGGPKKSAVVLNSTATPDYGRGCWATWHLRWLVIASLCVLKNTPRFRPSTFPMSPNKGEGLRRWCRMQRQPVAISTEYQTPPGPVNGFVRRGGVFSGSSRRV